MVAKSLKNNVNINSSLLMKESIVNYLDRKTDHHYNKFPLSCLPPDVRVEHYVSFHDTVKRYIL